MADLERGAGCRADRCLISRGRSRRPWADAYERRAKLLGLDAPARVSRAAVARDEVERDPTSYIVPVPATLSIEKWMAQLGSPGAADGKRGAG